MVVRSKLQKRVKKVLDESSEKIDNDFNLTNVIIDYKERQREKIMGKMKKRFQDLFVVSSRKSYGKFAAVG